LKKRAILMLTALAMAASMAACGDKKTDETAADSTEVAMTEAGTESTEAETESEEVLPEGMYRSELTNELIDESLKNQRPIAVMVDNESIALPHYGLSQADVVYEMMNSTLNGRITCQRLGKHQTVRKHPKCASDEYPDCIRVECSHLS